MGPPSSSPGAADAPDGGGARPAPGLRAEICRSPADFASVRDEWNELAQSRTPFVTHEWQQAWWRAFGGDEVRSLLIRDDTGRLVAGACVRSSPPRTVGSAGNKYSDDWDVIAADDDASRARIWREIGALPARVLTFAGIPGSTADEARDGLAAAGCRVNLVEQQLSPYVGLPGSWDELLAGQSRNHRSQIRRRRNRLEKEGALRFSTRDGLGPELEHDLDRFFRLEASGWKGESGSAILADPAAALLYSEFARLAAERGWLRLHFLELDGTLIAADYSCVLGDSAFLVKTCFDERYLQLAPGTVLRAEAIRAAIEEGLAVYEFLGGPDAYKVRWGGELRPRMLLRGYRGLGVITYAYRHRLRPLGARLRGAVEPGPAEAGQAS